MKTQRGTPRTYVDIADQDSLKKQCANVLQLGNIDAMVAEMVRYFQQAPARMQDFPSVEFSYSRTILGRAANGYEAVIARWSEGAVTLIHGHPQFGFYHLLDGCFQVTNYEKKKEGLVKVSEKVWQPGENFIIRGVAGRFDNGIHRIRALRECFSFHIYSDDALKGECFGE